MAETAAQKKEADATQAIIIDLGRQKRKEVKALSKGRGPLLEAIQSEVRELQKAGTLPAGVPPVIVLVGRKDRRQRLFGF
jgi:hypothetical protein